MFNSRTCQLVLGAGALHLVGLKNINTKNLGLLFLLINCYCNQYNMVIINFCSTEQSLLISYAFFAAH